MQANQYLIILVKDNSINRKIQNVFAIIQNFPKILYEIVISKRETYHFYSICQFILIDRRKNDTAKNADLIANANFSYSKFIGEFYR